MATVEISRNRNGYKIDEEEVEVGYDESVEFKTAGFLFKKFTIIFDNQVLKRFTPGQSYDSRRRFLRQTLSGRAVDQDEDSDYTLTIDDMQLKGRIIVRPPSSVETPVVVSLVKALLALLGIIAIGVIGAKMWP